MSNCTINTDRISPEIVSNREAYEKALPSLAAKYPLGYYAVFAGAVFLGAFPRYSEALETGYDKAGNTEFLVKQIKCNEEIQCVVSSFVLDA